MKKLGKILIFLIHLAFGFYFVNIGIKYMIVPEIISSFERWIILVGGILILVGGINYLRAGKKANLVGQSLY